MYQRTVTCGTTGCKCKGKPIVMTITENDPDAPPPNVFFCGLCGQQITAVA